MAKSNLIDSLPLQLNPAKLAAATVAIFKRLSGKLPQQELVQLLVEEEARIGGQLFDDYNPARPRQFVRIDNTSWLWREPTENGRYEQVVYQITPSAVYKQAHGQTEQVTAAELSHLQQAIHLYSQKVNRLYATL